MGVDIIGPDVSIVIASLIFPLETLFKISVALTLIVCSPSDNDGEILQEYPSVLLLKDPSLAAHAFQEPPSTLYSTERMFIKASVTLPLKIGVALLVGSGVIGLIVTTGGITSQTKFTSAVE